MKLIYRFLPTVLILFTAIFSSKIMADVSAFSHQKAMLSQHMQCNLTGLELSPYLEITRENKITLHDPFPAISVVATPLEGTAVEASIDLIYAENTSDLNLSYVREILIEDKNLEKPLHAIIKVRECVNPNDSNHITSLSISVPMFGEKERCCYLKTR